MEVYQEYWNKVYFTALFSPGLIVHLKTMCANKINILHFYLRQTLIKNLKYDYNLK